MRNVNCRDGDPSVTVPISRRSYLRGLAVGAAAAAGCADGGGFGVGPPPTPNRIRPGPGIEIVERPVEEGGIEVELVGTANGTVRQTHDAFAIEANGTVNGTAVTFRQDATAYAFFRGRPISSMDEPMVFVGPRLDPTDGVVDAYVVGWIERPETAPHFRALVYVDEDFRREVDGEINLAWGLDFLGHFRAYEFIEVADGVYRDEIVDRDVARFTVGRPAGPDVLVGNLSAGDVRNRTYRDRTFAFVR